MTLLLIFVFLFNLQLNTKSRSTVETLDKDLMEVRDILVSAPAKKEVQELKIKESTQHVPVDIDQAINDIASL